jgi:hypothetical protein
LAFDYLIFDESVFCVLKILEMHKGGNILRGSYLNVLIFRKENEVQS